MTSVWILQPVNVLCHPQMCRRVLGQPTPFPRQESEEDPQASQESPEEGSGPTSPHEEVEEEEVTSAKEVRLHLEESSPGTGTSQASIGGSPSHSFPNRASPQGSPLLLGPKPHQDPGRRPGRQGGWQTFRQNTSGGTRPARPTIWVRLP